MSLLLLPAILVLIALLAPRYGADTRWTGRGEPPHQAYRASLVGDLRTVGRRVTSVLRSARPRVDA